MTTPPINPEHLKILEAVSEIVHTFDRTSHVSVNEALQAMRIACEEKDKEIAEVHDRINQLEADVKDNEIEELKVKVKELIKFTPHQNVIIKGSRMGDIITELRNLVNPVDPTDPPR